MRWSLVAAMLAAVIVLVPAVWLSAHPEAFKRSSGQLCDGNVPVWYPSEGGCTEIPSLVEHLWPPERWGAPTFCQGLCLSVEEAGEQDRVRDEWRKAHPDAVAR